LESCPAGGASHDLDDGVVVGAQDPLFLSEGAHADLVLVDEWMVVGDDQHHRVVEQFADPQFVVGDSVPGEVPEQRECDRAFFQERDQGVPPGAADSELDVGVAVFEGADGDPRPSLRC
jgi:hypothetical protein